MNKKLADILRTLKTITFTDEKGTSVTVEPEKMPDNEGIGIAYTVSEDTDMGTNVGATLGFYMSPMMVATTIEGLFKPLAEHSPHLLMRVGEKLKEIMQDAVEHAIKGAIKDEMDIEGNLSDILARLGVPQDEDDTDGYEDVDTSSIDEVL